MSNVRSNVPIPSKNRSKYGFEAARDGDSTHFMHCTEADRFAAAFYSFRSHHAECRLKILRRKVDDRDPDGAGYRIWFVEDETDRATQRTKWDFTSIRCGDSIHVKTEADRANVMNAFKYWVKHATSNPKREAMQAAGAYASSEKVGREDPSGAGYRVWFLSKNKPSDNGVTQDDI